VKKFILLSRIFEFNVSAAIEALKDLIFLIALLLNLLLFQNLDLSPAFQLGLLLLNARRDPAFQKLIRFAPHAVLSSLHVSQYLSLLAHLFHFKLIDIDGFGSAISTGNSDNETFVADGLAEKLASCRDISSVDSVTETMMKGQQQKAFTKVRTQPISSDLRQNQTLVLQNCSQSWQNSSLVMENSSVTQQHSPMSWQHSLRCLHKN
jgi:hypothetical protein